MKKLLVLALVVSMLALTGSAFAAGDSSGHDGAGHASPSAEQKAVADEAKKAISDSDVSEVASNVTADSTTSAKDLLEAAIDSVVTTGSNTSSAAITAAKALIKAISDAVKTAVASLANNTQAKNAGIAAGTVSTTAVKAAVQKTFNRTDPATGGKVTTVKSEGSVMPLKITSDTAKGVTTPVSFDAPALSTSNVTSGTNDETTYSFTLTVTLTKGTATVERTNPAGLYAVTSAGDTVNPGSVTKAQMTALGNGYKYAFAALGTFLTNSGILAEENDIDMQIVSQVASETTSSSGAASGSGGGCAAGTSAAALALAVFGFVAAKRRA